MQGSIDLSATAIDPPVAVDSGLLHDVLPSGFTSGIYGNIDGIYAGSDAYGILDGVNIYNTNGQIVGALEDGIDFNSIFNAPIYIENGYGMYGPGNTLHTVGGSIWGGSDGVYGSDSQSVYAYNDLGWITGVQNGIYLTGVGETGIGNLGGSIVGYWGKGIHVESYSIAKTKATGLTGSASITAAASISAPGRRPPAPATSSAEHGHEYRCLFRLDHQRGLRRHHRRRKGFPAGPEPVHRELHHRRFRRGLSGQFGRRVHLQRRRDDQQTQPQFQPQLGVARCQPDADHSFDWTQLATDTSNFASFVTSGGASGDLTMLPSYGQTASDLLVHSEDGAGLWSMAAVSVRGSSIPCWTTAIPIQSRRRPPCSAGSR